MTASSRLQCALVIFSTSFAYFHFHPTLELTCVLILTLCLNLNLSLLLSTAQTNTFPCIQFGMNLVSDNITIMRKARDNPDFPQGVTVYTGAAEKKYGVLKYIGAGCTRSALARQQSFEKVPSSSVYQPPKANFFFFSKKELPDSLAATAPGQVAPGGHA